MQKVITNNYRIRPNGTQGQNGSDTGIYKKSWNKFKFNELGYKKNLVIGLKTKLLAIAIFLFHFIEAGTVNLVPEKSLLIYRNVKISDLILYGLIAYSLYCYKEYKDLLKSRAFLLPKLFLIYLTIEFGISFLRYGFNPLEYFFRLKGLWTSFLVFPYMLLLKRKGFLFLFKIMFPVALISNFLYILSALTGIEFLSSVTIFKQELPGNIEIYRVYGGTFYGDVIFLAFIYYWVTKKFRLWQLIPTILFIIPHILAFGRLAWAMIAFTIFMILLLNILRKKRFKVILRNAVLIVLFSIALIFSFIQFIPESSYYIDAFKSRLTQGREEVEYSEGSYGSRVLTQNDALIKLWGENDIMLGIGMHPMWVVKPESREESIYYGAFCDVTWPSLLAAYGLIGLSLALLIQFSFISMAIRIVKKIPQYTYVSFFTTILLAKLLFDLTVGFSYVLTSTSFWGFNYINFHIAFLVCGYEYLRTKDTKYASTLVSEVI